MYLVIVRCGIDDLPLKLFGSFAEAEAFATAVGKNDVQTAKRVLNLDTSVFHGIDVIAFDEDGVIEKSIPIRDLEDEDIEW